MDQDQPATKRAKHAVSANLSLVPADLLTCILQFSLTTIHAWRYLYGVSRYWRAVMRTRRLVYAHMVVRLNGKRTVREDLISYYSSIPFLGHLDLSFSLSFDDIMQLTTDELNYVTPFSSLLSLTLRGVEAVNDLSLGAISSLTNLRKLDLGGSYNLFHLDALSKLENLQDLNLEQCDGITAEGMTALQSLTALCRLNLEECTAIHSLRFLSLPAFAGLEYLSISNLPHLVDISALTSQNLPTLTELDFSWYITPSRETFTAVGRLTSLEVLRLWPAEEHPENKSVEDFYDTVIYFHGYPDSDILLPLLRNLTRLRILFLETDRFSREDWENLMKFLPHIDEGISGTSVEFTENVGVRNDM